MSESQIEANTELVEDMSAIETREKETVQVEAV